MLVDLKGHLFDVWTTGDRFRILVFWYSAFERISSNQFERKGSALLILKGLLAPAKRASVSFLLTPLLHVTAITLVHRELVEARGAPRQGRGTISLEAAKIYRA